MGAGPLQRLSHGMVQTITRFCFRLVIVLPEWEGVLGPVGRFFFWTTSWLGLLVMALGLVVMGPALVSSVYLLPRVPLLPSCPCVFSNPYSYAYGFSLLPLARPPLDVIGPPCWGPPLVLQACALNERSLSLYMQCLAKLPVANSARS